jgi:hypothetical protein
MTTSLQAKTTIEFHEWFEDHGWTCDETLNNGATLWRWPINDHILEIPYEPRVIKIIALAFLAANIMEEWPEPQNPYNRHKL